VTTALTQPDAPIPIPLSAATWGAEGRRETSLADWISREAPAIDGKVAGLIDAHQAILLVDGLDEVPAVRGRKDDQGSVRDDLIDQLPPVCPLVVAGRPEAFDAVRHRLGLRVEFALQPLTDQQISSFSGDVIDVSAILGSDHVLHELARSPLLLTMLCSAIGFAGTEPAAGLPRVEARDVIVDAFVRSRFDRESASPSLRIEDLRHALGGLLAMDDAGGGGNRNLFSMQRVHDQLGADLLELAHRMGVLVTTQAGAVRFCTCWCATTSLSTQPWRCIRRKRDGPGSRRLGLVADP
jgi:hypothetical protein